MTFNEKWGTMILFVSIQWYMFSVIQWSEFYSYLILCNRFHYIPIWNSLGRINREKMFPLFSVCNTNVIQLPLQVFQATFFSPSYLLIPEVHLCPRLSGSTIQQFAAVFDESLIKAVRIWRGMGISPLFIKAFFIS